MAVTSFLAVFALKQRESPAVHAGEDVIIECNCTVDPHFVSYTPLLSVSRQSVPDCFVPGGTDDSLNWLSFSIWEASS
ncbi:hypothetical protein SAMN05216564_1251 [Halopenitus persicus]|uniref:Uncharacterized protein n=1 Tax=Halopenitus persicus TaxID=1048396 RepID=A0A1H3PCR4_9EURY|nr:hypothetical protein SAMN05216564_1251 [Halopenitus persicus]